MTNWSSVSPSTSRTSRPSYYFTFGYIQAWATHQVLEAAVANGDLSRDGIIAALNGLDELNFGDLRPAYVNGPPEDRDPPRGSTVFEVNTDKPFSLGALVDQRYITGGPGVRLPVGGLRSSASHGEQIGGRGPGPRPPPQL